MSYQDVLEQAQQLSPEEKVRLLAELSASLQRDLRVSKHPKHSLLGIWQGVDISEQEIDQMRHDLWGHFPREDVG